MERCPSGLRCKPGTFVWGQLHRGFESRLLRIKREYYILVFSFNIWNENITKHSFVYSLKLIICLPEKCLKYFRLNFSTEYLFLFLSLLPLHYNLKSHYKNLNVR